MKEVDMEENRGPDYLTGERVRLSAFDPEKHAALLSRWGRNSEYLHLLDSDPPRLWSAESVKKWIAKELEKENPGFVIFVISLVDGDQPIGFVDLNGINLLHGDCWLGIGIGEPEFWGSGYGTEAMQLVLRYAFEVLSLHRVTLNVFEFNTRAIRSYEKAGYRIEGRQREAMLRDGRRWDILFMGVLREDWERLRF
jgi:RimJ/RimL family protein N-acetyltransferase